MPVLVGSSPEEKAAKAAHRAKQAELKVQREKERMEALQKAAATEKEERQKQHKENMRKEKIRVKQEAIELAAMNCWLEYQRKAKKAYGKWVLAQVEADAKGLENGTHRLENFAGHTVVVEKGIRPRSVDAF
jgi:hypothetical protein